MDRVDDLAVAAEAASVVGADATASQHPHAVGAEVDLHVLTSDYSVPK